MKSYVRELLSVWAAILADVAYAYPDLKSELTRDWARLSRLALTRGVPLFTVDLPALGKHLDRCLTRAEYSRSGLPASQPVSRSVHIPKMFRGVYLLLFDGESLRLKEDVDVQALLLLRQLLYGAKKANFQCSDLNVKREIASFVETDDQLPDPPVEWTSDQQDETVHPASVERQPDGGIYGFEEGRSKRSPSHTRKLFSNEMRYVSKLASLREQEQVDGHRLSHPSGRNLLAMLDTVVGIVSTTLGAFSPLEWDFRHGPGVVSDKRPGENRYRFTNWSPILETAFPLADCAFHDYASWIDRITLDSVEEIYPNSRLIAVPKSYTKPRLIASEPSEHMWTQQALGSYFHARVAATWIGRFVKFDDQRLNQKLCRKGSRTGKLATIDLSAASDRLSCLAVDCLFGANPSLLQALRAVRTQFCEVPDKGLMRLRKYATMGNATTFPVQSLMFLSIALTGVLASRGLSPTLRNIKRLTNKVSVFGDDIIIPTESWGSVTALLEVLDFKVNVDKSYSEGFFRESCGVDAYRGSDVTPAYWRGVYTESPESYAMTVDVANNFYKKFLVTTAEYLRSTATGRIRFPVVPVDSGASGWFSFVEPETIALKTRWNEGLQRVEYRAPCFYAKVRKKPITDDSALLQFFTEHPDPAIQWQGGVAEAAVLKIKHRWVSEQSFMASAPSIDQLEALGRWRDRGDFAKPLACR